MELTLNLDQIAMKQLRGAMAEFTNDVVAERRMIGAMKKTLSPTLKRAKQGAKRDNSSGATSQSIHLVKGRKSSLYSPYVVIRVKDKKIGNQSPRHYQHNMILGTRKGVRESIKGFVVYGSGGRAMRIHKIKHPGTKGIKYMDDAWNQTRSQVTNAFMSSLQRDIKNYKRRNNLT